MAILAVRDLPGTGSTSARPAPCGHSRPCGCDPVSRCCGDCHLPRCRDEEPFGLVGIQMERRRMLARGLRRGGASIRTIANTLRMSHRTVYKVLEGA